MSQLKWHHWIPVPFAPIEEFYYSEHEYEDIEMLLFATGASAITTGLMSSPWRSPTAGLWLMRSMYVTAPALLAVETLLAAQVEMDLVETIAKQESTPSWWKIFILSGI